MINYKKRKYNYMKIYIIFILNKKKAKQKELQEKDYPSTS